MAMLLEAGNNVVGCGELVAVVLVLERFGQDEVVVYVVGEHDEVVDATRAERKTTHFVGVYFSDVLYPDIELFLLCDWQLVGCCIGGRHFSEIARFCRLDGADALPCLFGVALQIFGGNRAILGHVGVGEAWSGIVVSCFYGCDPVWFDRETCSGMEVSNKQSNTGEVVGVEGDSTLLSLCWGGSVLVGE